MPPFLHFYQGYTHVTYRRIPYSDWSDLVAYMQKVTQAA